MLTLTRKENTSLFIEPYEDIDPNMTVAELFADGGIEIYLDKAQHNQIRIGIDAPKALNMLGVNYSGKKIPGTRPGKVG